MYLPKPVIEVISRLEACGYEAYAVGGCVRDTLMGRTPGDYDVTTSARPDEMLRCFAGWRVVETGLQHGTVTVVRDGMNIETTAYRIDGVYADHRHPAGVTFTDSLEDDLSRRDFTVNAMAYSDARGIVDCFGGREDLDSRVIRCVGDPETRFREDGLRILRAMRFAAVLDFTVDGNTADAAFALAPLLVYISRERICAETKKLICGIAAPRILRRFAAIAASVFPDVTAEQIDAGAAAVERLQALPEIPESAEVCVRLAALFSALPEDTFRAAIRSLKLSRQEEAAIRMCRDAMPAGASEQEISRRLLGRYGLTGARRRILYEAAAGTASPGAVRERMGILRDVEAAHLPNTLQALAVTGNDLQSAGIRGREVGKTLQLLLDAVITGAVPNEYDALMRLAAGGPAAPEK